MIVVVFLIAVTAHGFATNNLNSVCIGRCPSVSARAKRRSFYGRDFFSIAATDDSVDDQKSIVESDENDSGSIAAEFSWWDELWSDDTSDLKNDKDVDSVSEKDAEEFTPSMTSSSFLPHQEHRKNIVGDNGIEFTLPRCSARTPEELLKWDNEEDVVPRHDRDGTTDTIVVLVTQCSLDRLDRLKKQARAWGGYVSVAIYIPDDSTDWKEEIEEAFQDNRTVAASIVFKEQEDDPYPINYLRNVALLQAREQHIRLSSWNVDQLSVFLVDVDFVPCSNLHSVLHTETAKHVLKDEVVVVPAFEAVREDESGGLPTTMEELHGLYGGGKADSFDAGRFPQGHSSTNFTKYWSLSLAENSGTTVDEDSVSGDYFWNKRYEVQHTEGFEPYVVMAANKVPLYDERFQGYGLNKIIHLASVATFVSRTFMVLPGVFLVAATHAPSNEFRRIYGKDKSSTSLDLFESKKKASLQSNLRALYKDFCQRLEDGDAPVVSDATSSRFEALKDSRTD